MFDKLDLSKVSNSSPIGIIIEVIRRSKYIYADIDSLTGRLAMLLTKPLITKRKELDVRYLSPINPYESVVIGCDTLRDGILYLEKRK
jgi:hypothetical protein